MTPQTLIVHDAAQQSRAAKIILALPLSQPFDVTICPHVDRRSSEQNARLWKLHGLAAEHVGCDAEDMHEEMLCRVYGYSEVKMPSGDVKRKPLKRSSQRNKVEFAKFMEQVETFYVTELGVFLP